MADLQDDFDPEFEPDTAGVTGDDFDPDYEPPAIVADASETAREPAPWYEDLALGAVDGLTLNNAGELGGIGERLGNLAADEMDLFTGRNEIDGMGPTKSGDGEDWEALYQLARESLPGKIGHGAGLVNTGAALSQLAPGTVGGQAVSGGASGALSTGGDTDYDMLSTLIGGAAGAALGGLGGAVGSGADAVRRWLGGASSEGAQMALPGLASKVTRGSELLDELAFVPKDIVSPLKSAWKLAAQGGVRAAQSPVTADAARGVAGAMAGTGPQALSSMLGATKAGAQDAMPWSVEIGEAQPLGDYTAEIGEAQPLGPWTAEIGEAQIREKAYAGDAALNYGVQTVLSSGRSGLPPKAERDLTSALLAGDSDKFNAMNFKLQQRHPGYAKRLQDELNSLSEDIP